MRTTLMVLVLSIALAACGGGSEPATPDDVAAEVGCDSFTEVDTEELFVQRLYDCDRDGEPTSVYTFASSEARDNWRNVAEDFGSVVVDEGPTWLEVES